MVSLVCLTAWACADAPVPVSEPGSADGASGYSTVASVGFRSAPGDTLHALIGGRVIHAFAPAEGGFARGLVPALEQERRLRQLDMDAPFTLAVDAEGIPLFVDPLTDTRIDLPAFGPEAVQFFNLLIEASAAPPEASS